MSTSSSDEPCAGQIAPPTSAKKKWSPIARGVVWTLIGALLILVGIEWQSRRGYNASVEALNELFESHDQSSYDTALGDAETPLRGSFTKSVKEEGRARVVEFRWPSLFKTYVIELKTDSRDIVFNYATAAGRDSRVGIKPQFGRRPASKVPAPAPSVPAPAPSAPAPLRGLPAGMDDVVVVKTKAARTAGSGDGTPQGLLLRELPRQALLIAARDELGRSTRDRTLREEIPDQEAPVACPLEVVAAVDAKRRVTVEITGRQTNGKALVWSSDPIELPSQEWLPAYAEANEALSRDKLPDVLRQAGYRGKANAWIASQPVGQATEDRLLKMDFFSQFAALRELHREMAASGESPEVLGGLARGYATLGALTGHLWSPAHAAFSARGLLYAERMVARTSGAPQAFAHRAYARGLVGLHRAALDDVARSRAPFGGKRPPDPLDEPRWVELVRAFCAYDPEVLSDAAGRHPRDVEGELPRFLQLLWVEQTREEQGILAASEAMHRINPACDLALQVRFDLGQLGVAREASSIAHADFADLVYRRIAEVPNVSADVARHAAECRKASFKGLAGEAEMAAEARARQKLVQLLKKSGAAGRDRGEPSWDVLGQLVLETGFVGARRVLDFEGRSLGVPVDDTLATLKPLAEGHPFADFLEWHHLDKVRQEQALKRLDKRLDPEEIEQTETPMLTAFFHSSLQDRYFNLGSVAISHVDEVSHDLARWCWQFYNGRGAESVVKKLLDVSPHWPLSAVLAVRFDWNESQPKVAEWERRFPGNIALLRALSYSLREAHRDTEAEQVLEREIRVMPTLKAWWDLGEFRFRRGDEPGWLEALEKALTFPALGLEHALIHEEIASQFMIEGEYRKALPHADEAAQSYSSFGLLCAARCHEQLNDNRVANALYRANAERYDTDALEWLLFCHRSGGGDRAEAERLAKSQLTDHGRGVLKDAEQGLAMFRALTGDRDGALAGFHLAANRLPDVGIRGFSFYYAFALADELGKTELRQSLLREISLLEQSHRTELPPWQRKLFPVFRQLIDGGLPEPVPPALFENVILEAAPGDVTAICFFAGMFLAERGEHTLSRKYLQLAATSPIRKWSCAGACEWLRRHGETVGKPRATELDEPLQRAVSLYRRAISLRKDGKLEEAAAACAELLKLKADLSGAAILRAQLFADLGRLDEALADLNIAVRILPRDPAAHIVRGDVHQRRGESAAAIADYRTALESYPNAPDALRGAAWVLAVAEDDAVRDARAALRYAEQLQREQGQLTTWRDNEIVAAALAANGRFEEAESRCSFVLAHIDVIGRREWDANLSEISRQRDLYKSRRPFQPR